MQAVRIHCPVSAIVLARLQAGEAAAIGDDPVLAAVVGIIRGDGALGVIAPYRGVFELGFGLESFVPGDMAVPASGRAGEASVVPSVVVKTYVAADADPGAVEAALAKVLAAHPWEVPVVEVSPVALVVRG
jgi:hypothetical protein